MRPSVEYIPAILVAAVILVVSSRPAAVSSTVNGLYPSSIERLGTQVVGAIDGVSVIEGVGISNMRAASSVPAVCLPVGIIRIVYAVTGIVCTRNQSREGRHQADSVCQGNARRGDLHRECDKTDIWLTGYDITVER